jgi:hypothetical protein
MNRDPRIRYLTALKVERLQKRIDALIRADIDAHERRLRDLETGLRKRKNGALDRRTREWRQRQRQAEAGSAVGAATPVADPPAMP